MSSVHVNRIIDRHGAERASLIPVLQDIQDDYNWISEPHLRQVADRLGLPLSEVYGVASFYRALSLEPRGKTLIRVCKGTACHVRGAQLIQEELERQLGIQAGGTTEDMAYTLEVVNCVGACGMAPVVIVGDKYFPGVKPHRAKKLVQTERDEE
ncbi:MAG: NADH-quinone oxidoreductase subunit NuoE [Deltaproteobacteria bacterium]|nr:NADH-quinone oxidoreductase subunit NuoE [Deltaproteobacteria bacterium]